MGAGGEEGWGGQEMKESHLIQSVSLFSWKHNVLDKSI